MMNLPVKQLGKKWWILGGERFGMIGPYDRKADAEEDRRGLLRFDRYEDEPGYVTVESWKEESEVSDV